jgi:hypothetical protein
LSRREKGKRKRRRKGRNEGERRRRSKRINSIEKEGRDKGTTIKEGGEKEGMKEEEEKYDRR